MNYNLPPLQEIRLPNTPAGPLFVGGAPSFVNAAGHLANQRRGSFGNPLVPKKVFDRLPLTD